MTKLKNKKIISFFGLSFLGAVLVVINFSSTEAPQNPLPAGSDEQSLSSNEAKSNEKKQPNKPAAPSTNDVDETPLASSANFKNYEVNLDDNSFTIDGKTYPLRVYEPLALPNDTYANQWWVGPTGMEQAWSVPAGPYQTKTAIIDTGYALNHEEFSGRWATSSGESGATIAENPSYLNCSDRALSLNRSCNNIDDNLDGIVDNETGFTSDENPSWLNCTDRSITLDKSCNRVDDDVNGQVDDYRGWDFSNYDHSPQAGEVYDGGSDSDHGTMTSGVLGATGNNGVGIAGVNWYTDILPIQALDDYGYGNSLTVGNSVYYAVDQGVDIISISLGTSADDPFLRQAILYAMENDVVVVAASGNNGCECIVYPANYPEVVAVGASNSSNTTASFSNFGAELDIVAPGQNITTSYWTKDNQTSAYASNVAGTSFSTPFVAGVLGLLRSNQPNASWDELTGILYEESNRKSLTASAPHSKSFGFGYVLSDQALNRVSQAYSPISNYRFSGTILGTERIKVCDAGMFPGSYLYELTKNGQVDYTVNQYERRKKTANSWTSKKLFGLCVGLPTDTPDFIRTISLTQEIRNQQLKQ